MSRLPAAIALSAIGVIAAASVARALGGPESLAAVVLAASVALVASQFGRIPRQIRITCALLFALALLLAPLVASPRDALVRGSFIAGVLVALLASVQLLARSALRTRPVQQIGDALLAQPAARRYLAFTVAGQAMAAMLSLAGSNVLFAIAGRSPAQGVDRLAMFSAITRGFSAAICWSPIFGNMAILLALYPSLHWIDVFLPGFALAQMSVLVGLLLDRRRHRNAPMAAVAPPASAAPLAARTLGRTALMATLVAALLVAALAALSVALSVSITVAIVVIGPLAAFALTALRLPAAGRLRAAWRQTAHDATHLPGTASEALLFLTAGIAGTMIAAAVPSAWIAALGQIVAGLPIAGFLLVMLMVVGLSTVGVHPVLAGIFVANAFTPQALGLPALPHFCAVLTGWGLAASATPFSILNLTAARHAGFSTTELSVRANGLFTAITILLTAALLAAATALAV